MADKYHGNGIMMYPSGSYYVGDFFKGLRHGKGVCTFINGKVYDG